MKKPSKISDADLALFLSETGDIEQVTTKLFVSDAAKPKAERIQTNAHAAYQAEDQGEQAEEAKEPEQLLAESGLEGDALFHEVFGDVERLAVDQQHPDATAKTLPEATAAAAFKDTPTQARLSAEFDPIEVGSEQILEFQREEVKENTLNQLRSGRFKIEASLDLHGMTAAIACQALEKFLSDCHQYQIHTVRIVHGKGWSSKDNKPVLKSMVNAWLQQTNAVQAFCSTPEHDGGAGAVYALLE
jgi:DNA-nicking Smr family endonuclease